MHIESEPFDLSSEVAIVAGMFEIEGPDPTSEAWAIGDPLRTRQVLRNLLTNARRYGGGFDTQPPGHSRSGSGDFVL